MLYSRWTSFVGLLICLGLLIFAAYLQVKLGLMPCPLCVLQRIFLLLIGLMFLLNSLYTPIHRYWRRFHSLLITLFATLGALVALRHLWLEHQPPGQLPSCSPTLGYMLQNLPLNQTLKLMLQGSGDCAKVTWKFLNLSIPAWTLIFFLAFALFGIVRFIAAGGKENR